MARELVGKLLYPSQTEGDVSVCENVRQIAAWGELGGGVMESYKEKIC